MAFSAVRRQGVKNPHRKPPPIARAHCTAHCTAHCIGTAVWQGFWVCQERVVSRGSPTGFRRLQRARLLPCLTPTHSLVQLEFRISLDNVSHYFRALLLETCRCKDGVQVSSPKNFGAWRKIDF